MELSEVKQKIQDLINKAVEDNNQQKNTLSFLFDKLAEVKELETIDRLRQFQGGNKYLLAYLTYKSIVRANFQPELTENTKYDEDEQGQDKLLNAIYADVEQFEKKSEPKPLTIEQLSEHLSDRQLLTILSERMRTNKIIKREYNDYGKWLVMEDEAGVFKLNLDDCKLEPDPAQELLKKHGFIDSEAQADQIRQMGKIKPNTAEALELNLDITDEDIESVKKKTDKADKAEAVAEAIHGKELDKKN